MTRLTPAEQRDKQYRELAATIADQARAIADGTLAGPRYAMAQLIARNAQQLVAETPDDRSGMPGAEPDDDDVPEIYVHIRELHPKIATRGVRQGDLRQAHARSHHNGDVTTHHHGPNAGPHARPRGWRDGSGVVLIDHQAAMRRKPPGAPEQES
jgi:hypothetical protein